jgi:hypothetical protein
MPIRIARSERTARSCDVVRQLAVDWDRDRRGGGGQPSQAEFDAIKAKALA